MARNFADGVVTVAFDVASDDLRLLVEIGFMGIGRARFAEAAVIFDAVRALRPESESGLVGGALAALGNGQTETASQMLRAAPQTDSVLAFRALVAGRMGDRALAQELVADLGFVRGGPAALDIAKGALRH